MVAVPIPNTGQPSQPYRMRFPQPFPASESAPVAEAPAATIAKPATPHAKDTDWTTILAAATLVAGGALMLSGHRKIGLAVAAAGTGLALIDEQDMIKDWWKSMPGYLQEAQAVLDKVEGYLNEANVQGQKIQGILRR